MKIRRVAIIVFYDDKKRILLQDRKGISKVGEEWGFFGGEIEGNETPEQAVVRETKEELCFYLKNYKFIGIFYGEVKNLKLILYTFISKLRNISEFKIEEGTNMRLFTLDEAEKLKMVSDGDKEIIRKLKEILR